jgi:hypothetical protein
MVVVTRFEDIAQRELTVVGEVGRTQASRRYTGVRSARQWSDLCVHPITINALYVEYWGGMVPRLIARAIIRSRRRSRRRSARSDAALA